MTDQAQSTETANRREGVSLSAMLHGDMPWSPMAEEGILSAIFQDPVEYLAEVRRAIEPEAFFSEQARTIYLTMVALSDESKMIEPILVTNHLRDQGKLDKLGGPSRISEIYTFIPVGAMPAEYLRIVRSKWLMREAIRAHAESIEALKQATIEEAAAGDAEPYDVTQEILAGEERVFEVCRKLQADTDHQNRTLNASIGVNLWLEHLQQVISNRGKVVGLRTGIHEIDQTFHGIDDRNGEIMVIAARPGMGKTAMAVTIARNLALEQNVPGLFFSLEMSAEQIWTRLILGGAGIDTSKAITGHFQRHEQEEIGVHTARWQRSAFHLNATSALTTADLRTEVQLAKRQHGIRWIVVDHLHLVKPVGMGKKDERMKLVEVMETLQFLKKEFHLGIFLLVQLNRETDRNKAGQMPVLADLSGSAAIEQYADHVMFIHRPEEVHKWHALKEETQKAWARTIEPRRRRSPQCWSDGLKYTEEAGGFARQDYEEDAICAVRKNRRGPTAEFRIRYEREFTRFGSRMPKLNSNDPLDHQMGSYLDTRAAPGERLDGGKKGRRGDGETRRQGDGEMGDIWPEGEE